MRRALCDDSPPPTQVVQTLSLTHRHPDHPHADTRMEITSQRWRSRSVSSRCASLRGCCQLSGNATATDGSPHHSPGPSHSASWALPARLSSGSSTATRSQVRAQPHGGHGSKDLSLHLPPAMRLITLIPPAPQAPSRRTRSCAPPSARPRPPRARPLRPGRRSRPPSTHS